MELETTIETLEQLQSNDPICGVDILRSGLSDQGFGNVEVPGLDLENNETGFAEHRGRLIGVTAIAMGGLALVAPSAVSAEQVGPTPGIVANDTAGRHNTNPTYAPLEILPDPINFARVTPGKYRKINARCVVTPFKISSTGDALNNFAVSVASNTASNPKDIWTFRAAAVLDTVGIKVPVKVCQYINFKKPTAKAYFSLHAQGTPMVTKGFNFNWSKKKWTIDRKWAGRN